MTDALKIANCSGYYGDRISAAREAIEGGPIDILCGDYLAELTMQILQKSVDSGGVGYAVTFLRQMEDVLDLALGHGIRIITNAGGIDPNGLAHKIAEFANTIGKSPKIAVVDGDSMMERLNELRDPVTGGLVAQDGSIVAANAYLGCWGIVNALSRGADVVICSRVTDASLTVGPAAWYFGWSRSDWDALAGATAVGHVLECGAQATGGNYAFFTEIDSPLNPGFPIAEVADDGSAVITKHANTGGTVSTGTVTAQLLYEIDSPRYLGPDVTTQFETIRLEQLTPDRVRLWGTRGGPPPPTLKVGVVRSAGYRATMSCGLVGLNIEEKAQLVVDGLHAQVGADLEMEVRLIRTDRADASSQAQATAELQITVRDKDQHRAGRAFSNALVELGLSSYAGFYTTTPPVGARSFGVFSAAVVDARSVPQRVRLLGEETEAINHTSFLEPETEESDTEKRESIVRYSPQQSPGDVVLAPLGTLFGARSGDKGGNANLGVWARSDEAYAWLVEELTAERFKQLIPECSDLEVERYELPNLWALNFVIRDLLDQGVSQTSRPDPQAKGLGEFLRSRFVSFPQRLLNGCPDQKKAP